MPFAVPERLQVVDSTNRYLVGLVRAGLPDGSEVPEGYAVVADYQREGRGRLERRWEAPPGTAVLCSIVLKPDLGLGQLHLAAWAVALAAVRACRVTAGVELFLKWPNDLIAAGPATGREEPGSGLAADGRKVAGLLSEIVAPFAPGGTGAIVVGIGINANWPVDWPPAGSQDPELVAIAAGATSLNRLAGHRIDRSELVSQLLKSTGEGNAMLAGREAAALWPRSTASPARPSGARSASSSVTRPLPAPPSTSTRPGVCSSPPVPVSAPSPRATSCTCVELGALLSSGAPCTPRGSSSPAEPD